MITSDVLIVGGGPAGAACAWRLKQLGFDCLVLDKVEFPRFKPCAGWITPEVISDLGANMSDYPHSFTTYNQFLISIRGITLKVRTRQHAIRRIEFDNWLLRRANVPVEVHTVKKITVEDRGYDIDGRYFGKYLVGAGGTYCPVYRELFKSSSPKNREALIVAQEDEFLYPNADQDCRLWFLENGLPGYAWYVPKANGYINVGVGGKAEELNTKGDSLKRHWNLLVEKLHQQGLVQNHQYQPSAHSYYLRQRLQKVRIGNAFIIGDAAGLATMDMGEGIGLAIKSGLRAADAIGHQSEYKIPSYPKLSFWSIIRHGLF